MTTTNHKSLFHVESASIIPFPKNQGERISYCGLHVDLDAVKQNYRFLQQYSGAGTICSAVVKANAYGIGAIPCAKALYDAGCRHFFVAYLDEAFEIQSIFPSNDAKVYVLNGFLKGQEDDFFHNGFIPVLTDVEKIERWAHFGKVHNAPNLPAVLHIDTGMNRTGLRFDRINHPVLMESLVSLDIQMIISHLACAEDISNPFNEIQRKRFVDAVADLQLPYKPFLSLGNSGAFGLGRDYYFDMIRPGIALYGGGAESRESYGKMLQPVLRLWARIYQIQTVPAFESIGYGQHYIAETDRKIATVTLGYADGFAWKASDAVPAPFVMIGEFQAPIVGRVSMDLITIDVTDVPSEYIYEGAIVDVLNQDITINHLGKWMETLPYEVLLKFGNRLYKTYND